MSENLNPPVITDTEETERNDPTEPYRILGQSVREHDELLAEILYELTLLELA